MNDSLFSVEGKSVIVTGASRGIGQAIAEGFLAAGAKVMLVARSESIHDRAVQGPVSYVAATVCDLGEEAASQRICAATVEAFGSVDVVVNNAGITLPGKDTFSDEVTLISHRLPLGRNRDRASRYRRRLRRQRT